MINDKAKVIEELSKLIEEDAIDRGKNLLQLDYPHQPFTKQVRKYTTKDSLELFIRDGFIDRYSGKRLVYIGALKILSHLMPEQFPYHKNWKMSDTHIAYWELAPTLDHIIPVARGGLDEISNWATTSQAHNSAKSNWTLEQIGWQLYPQGNMSEWDGLLGWATEYIEIHRDLLTDSVIRNWHSAAKKECLSN